MGDGRFRFSHMRSGAREGCRHSGFYSGIGIYLKESRTLRYVLVCDDCGEEIKEISVLDYLPEPVLADV